MFKVRVGVILVASVSLAARKARRRGISTPGRVLLVGAILTSNIGR